MDYRGVLLVGMVCGASVLGATSACSGPDPGQITFSERPRGSGSEIIGGGTSSGSTAEGGTSSGGTDGGSGEGGSSGAPDPVFGTSAFVAGTPPGGPAKAANGAHGGDASGKDCLVTGCHLGGNAPWAFGGTLYNDAAGTARVAGAEIRITGADGKLYASAFSDVDGNFWIDNAAPIPANSRVGVRTAAGLKMNMAGTVGPAEAGCSKAGTCHGGSAGKVYVK